MMSSTVGSSSCVAILVDDKICVLCALVVELISLFGTGSEGGPLVRVTSTVGRIDRGMIGLGAILSGRVRSTRDGRLAGIHRIVDLTFSDFETGVDGAYGRVVVRGGVRRGESLVERGLFGAVDARCCGLCGIFSTCRISKVGVTAGVGSR